ncbi:hypothetical protein ACQ7HM_20935 [Williamsia sp. MIQD14]|uniref:hypothetical protein n=1 Tax=Williamsia sp. MIQD14 TaxID=3425703 RepID=UPI003DA0BE7F
MTTSTLRGPATALTLALAVSLIAACSSSGDGRSAETGSQGAGSSGGRSTTPGPSGQNAETSPLDLPALAIDGQAQKFEKAQGIYSATCGSNNVVFPITWEGGYPENKMLELSLDLNGTPVHFFNYQVILGDSYYGFDPATGSETSTTDGTYSITSEKKDGYYSFSGKVKLKADDSVHDVVGTIPCDNHTPPN